MAKRGRKTKHTKRSQAEQTVAAATEGTGGASTTSTTVPMPEETSLQAIIKQFLQDDTETDTEGDIQSTPLREIIRKGLKIMMEPRTSVIAQDRFPTAPKLVETVKAVDQQMAEEMLKKVFDMVEVMFIKLIITGEVSKDFSSISFMPQNKGQGEQHLPKKMDEWSLDQYKLLITRLSGHVTIIMLNHLMHSCKSNLSDDSILLKIGFTKSVHTLTHNLAMQAANTSDHNKFKDYMKPGSRSKPFHLPGKAPTPLSAAAYKKATGPLTPLSGVASKKATGPPTPLSGAVSGVATGSASTPLCNNQQATALPVSRPVQTASKPQSATALPPASVAARPAQTACKPQSGTAQPPVSVASRSVKREDASAAPVRTLTEKPQRVTMMVIEVVLSSVRDLTRLGMLPVKTNV